MDRAPSSVVADHARSPEKDAIDFWSQSIQSSDPHLLIWRNICESPVTLFVCAVSRCQGA
jgi:hypothetical protein